jgi:hypothetical protein
MPATAENDPVAGCAPATRPSTTSSPRPRRPFDELEVVDLRHELGNNTVTIYNADGTLSTTIGGTVSGLNGP